VNDTFAKAIRELRRENEMVWIHDNYLLLVPVSVRRRDLTANIGFYFHSPFPSSDIFKMFPHRVEILKSVLACDVVGFHIFEYARNFYTSCRRVLGLNYDYKRGGHLSIEYCGRTVFLRIGHVGIQKEDIQSVMESPEFETQLRKLHERTQGKLVISSVDRMHQISGLRNKLQAYLQFLRDRPEHAGHTILIQVRVLRIMIVCISPRLPQMQGRRLHSLVRDRVQERA